jgi:LysR family glycine cleavage system transcriptional activator
LIPRFLIEEELRSGRLVEVVRHAYLSDRSYYLIYPERKSENPTLTTFRDWLAEEAGHYRDAAGLG